MLENIFDVPALVPNPSQRQERSFNDFLKGPVSTEDFIEPCSAHEQQLIGHHPTVNMEK
jgi:hypothetical protein